MILDRPTRDFLDATASSDSTPGGGAVAALAGALGAALGAMSCHYTIGPKKFADREEAVRALLDKLEAERQRLAAIVQDDIDAYGAFTTAMAMPRDTAEAKAARKAAMQEALVGAMEVPLACAGRCATVLSLLEELAPIANPRLLSDVGCAAVMADAGFHSARFNVLVNVAGLDPGETREAGVARMAELVEAVAGKCRTIVDVVESGLRVA